MKLVKLALFTVTLLAFAILTAASVHSSSDTTGIALATEPASWILVGFGLAGGGFLHTRRHPGLNLVSAPQSETPAQPQAAARTSRRSFLYWIVKPAQKLPGRRSTARPLRSLATAIGLSYKVCSSLATVLALLFFTNPAVADPIDMSSSPVSSIALSPSSDTVSLNSGSVTADPSAGLFTFQTGDFVVGYSNIPDQVISFSFQDTLTLNGITEILTFDGQAAVTSSADTLTISGGPAATFGNELLSVQDSPLRQTT